MNDNQLLYRASKYDCDGCALKPRCCPKEPARKVPRSTLEGARDMARDIAKTDAYSTSRHALPQPRADLFQQYRVMSGR